MECKGIRLEDYYTFLKVGCLKMKTVPIKPDKAMIVFIHKAWEWRKKNIEVEMKNHIIMIEVYLAFIGIPSPDLKRNTLSPKRGWLITQLYILAELRKKHAAAKIIKMVVGKPGIMTPARPSPVKNKPKEKYIILVKGICLKINFI